MKLEQLKCPICGGELSGHNGIYTCRYCGHTFKDTVETSIRNILDEHAQKTVSSLRRQLWDAMHEMNVHSSKIVGIAREIKKHLPDDYFATFCDIANSGSDIQLSEFLKSGTKEQIESYADVMLDFMLKSATERNLTAISRFIENAFKDDAEKHDKYATAFDEIANEVKNGVFELTLTRDVFLAYSSKDEDKVQELCDYLESNGISCFLAWRNLRHGRDAVDNYQQALQTAIDNCKCVVFVSSKNSRSLSCDALKRELPYIKQCDLAGAEAKYKHSYDTLPQENMMPRVEYLIDNYVKDEGAQTAQALVKEFFHDLEWCKSKEAVARRVAGYIATATKTNKKPKQKKQVDNQNLSNEQQLKQEIQAEIKQQKNLKKQRQEQARLEKQRQKLQQIKDGTYVSPFTATMQNIGGFIANNKGKIGIILLALASVLAIVLLALLAPTLIANWVIAAIIAVIYITLWIVLFATGYVEHHFSTRVIFCILNALIVIAAALALILQVTVVYPYAILLSAAVTLSSLVSAIISGVKYVDILEIDLHVWYSIIGTLLIVLGAITYCFGAGLWTYWLFGFTLASALTCICQFTYKVCYEYDTEDITIILNILVCIGLAALEIVFLANYNYSYNLLFFWITLLGNILNTLVIYFYASTIEDDFADNTQSITCFINFVALAIMAIIGGSLSMNTEATEAVLNLLTYLI